MSKRLGWLGPAIVILGLIVGGIGVWFMASSKPTPGVVIDEIQIDGGKVVIRGEAGGDRSFVELHQGDRMAWRALVPPYAGRKGIPAIAWGERAVSVRVIRDGKAEIFGLARSNASKLGGIHLAPGKGPVARDATGPITLHDGKRSYEIVVGDGWAQLIAVDLGIGKIVWEQALAPAPVELGGVEAGHVWIQQGGARRHFDVFTGKENRSWDKRGMPPAEGAPPPWPAPGTPDDVAPSP